MLGNASNEIKSRLSAVIDNPCQETWEDAYSIILSKKGKMVTLWQAVISIDRDMQQRKPLDSEWIYIPDSETIKKAIKSTVMEEGIMLN